MQISTGYLLKVSLSLALVCVCKIKWTCVFVAIMVKMCTVNQRYFLCMWRDKTTRNIKNYIILWNFDENQNTIKSCIKTYMYHFTGRIMITSIAFLTSSKKRRMSSSGSWPGFFSLGWGGMADRLKTPGKASSECPG